MKDKNAYDELAPLYDRFQSRRAAALTAELMTLLRNLAPKQVFPGFSFIESLRREKAIFVPLALDLGCGSGRISHLLLEQGWRVWGFDLSVEQIKLADEKAFTWEDEQWLPIEETFLTEYGEDAYIAKRQELRRYHFQTADLLDVDLIGAEADLAVCWLDTFNHLPPASWSAFCQNVARGLRTGAYFVFDYLTPEYMEKYYANQIYIEKVGDLKLKWNNAWNGQFKKNIAKLQMKSSRGSKTIEVVEYALNPQAVSSLLEENGFRLVFNRPSIDQIERYIVCAQKII